MVVVTANSNIDWNDVVKKEARGSGDEDLGEVQEVGPNYVLVKRGLVNKEKFYIPKDEVESYDGDTLRFRISEEEVKSKYMGESPPSSLTRESDDFNKSRTRDTADRTKVEETTVPVTEERLGVSKSQSTKEATITKTPVTETKTVEVPVTHEEISVERRPVSGTTTTTAADRPVESEQEIRVPLKQEQVQVTKQPYVKEEVAVKKKPVTETKTVSDQVTSEEVRVKGTGREDEEE
jgi:uncharacterized protein (TIGR02271 family)